MITTTRTLRYGERIGGTWPDTGRIAIRRPHDKGRTVWIITDGPTQDVHPTEVKPSGTITAQRMDLVGRSYNVYIETRSPSHRTISVVVEEPEYRPTRGSPNHDYSRPKQNRRNTQ